MYRPWLAWVDYWILHSRQASIPGDRGEIDFTVSRVHRAVEATVEAAISQVQSSSDLCLRCSIGGFDE
jgi:hypothetical protein